MKVILFAIIIITSLLPSIARAQLDPRCWMQDDCIEARKGFNIGNDQRPEDGFYSAAKHPEAAVCGEKDQMGRELGFCLPATKTITEISFGGKREFANIGEFIQLMYRYAIIIAGILATVIIMLAGIRWTASGGNAERIKSAQKMIGGAVAGLMIALLSYTILSSLNPATVNLRLPQVWMIRPQALGGKYCSQFKEFETTSTTPDCGGKYAVPGRADQTCEGDFCSELRNVCEPKKQKSLSACRQGTIAGNITAIQGFFSGTDLNQQQKKIIDGDIELLALCKDGTIKKADSMNASNQIVYFIAGPQDIKTVCDENNGLAGFFLGADVNDEGTGLLQPGDPMTTGVDDWHAIGQVAEGSHECRVNLAKKAYLIETGQSPPCKANECSCAFISTTGFAKKLASDTNFTKHLLTAKELTKGYVCDITISRSEFPAIDNSLFTSGDAANAILLQNSPMLVVYLQAYKIFDRYFIYNGTKEGAFTTCTEYQ